MVLTRARQVGKTALSFLIKEEQNAIYLDLERPSDFVKVKDIEQFCALNSDKLLILDEVQRIPELFAPLRNIIDSRRREEKKN